MSERIGPGAPQDRTNDEVPEVRSAGRFEATPRIGDCVTGQ